MSTNSPDGTSACERPARTVRIASLGCKVSGVESSALGTGLAARGVLPARTGEPAGLVVVQTCTVTERADRDARRLVRRLARENPGSRIVVTGCLARRDPAAAAAIAGADLALGWATPAALARVVDGPAAPLLPALSGPPALPQVQRDADHTRAFLEVQDGCARRCAFCIVPAVRGAERSARVEDVTRAVRSLGEEGVAEVVLAGIHLAAFAPDEGGLLALLRALEADPPRCRVRLSSLEPMEAGEALVAHVAASRVVAPHLHLPLQSGSDAVLRRMRRGMTAARFRALAARAAANPRLHLATDVIAGFPGETDAEFAESVALVEELPFASLHVFPFSPRSGTRASEMPGRLPPAVVTERAGALRALGERKSAAFAARAAGSEADVVALRGGRGLTDHYLEVALGPGAPPPGSRFRALLVPGRDGSGLAARPVYKVLSG